MTIRTDRSAMTGIRATTDWFLGRSRGVKLFLDGAFIAVAAAAFGQLGDPDVLFHVIWVVLTIQAFLFGLRVTAIRIVVAMGLLLLYFNLLTMTGADGRRMADLDLAEWPLMVVIAVIVAVMADRVATTSRRYAELYRQTSERLLTAQEDERKRLGRDLHDGVGQTLTAVVLTLDAAESMLWAGEQPPSTMGRSAMRRVQELAAIALEETRDVAHRLRPDRLVETGLVAAVARLGALAGVPIVVSSTPDMAVPGLLNPEDEMNVYRIIQEAVNNAVRHARAKRIAIDFRSDGDDMAVTITDDGIGFDPGASNDRGLGLVGMHERGLILRSTLDIQSEPGRGTSVRLTVPLPVYDVEWATASARPPVGGEVTP
jgi:signal transduction histidine kinase